MTDAEIAERIAEELEKWREINFLEIQELPDDVVLKREVAIILEELSRREMPPEVKELVEECEALDEKIQDGESTSGVKVRNQMTRIIVRVAALREAYVEKP